MDAEFIGEVFNSILENLFIDDYVIDETMLQILFKKPCKGFLIFIIDEFVKSFPGIQNLLSLPYF